MWSEPTTRAVRAETGSTVSSFWEQTPMTAQAQSGATPFVSLPSASASTAAVAAPELVQPACDTIESEPEARLSFAELERDAFMKGYAQGERAGAEAAARRGEATLRRLAQTVEQLAGLRTELVQKTEHQVVELALAIGERILQRELALDRELLIAMARVALDRLGENTSATIRLNPDDYAFIGAEARPGDGSSLRIVADPIVSSGGCLVQSDFGLIDVGIEAQLGEMASALGVTRTTRTTAPSRVAKGAA